MTNDEMIDLAWEYIDRLNVALLRAWWPIMHEAAERDVRDDDREWPHTSACAVASATVVVAQRLRSPLSRAMDEWVNAAAEGLIASEKGAAITGDPADALRRVVQSHVVPQRKGIKQ